MNELKLIDRVVVEIKSEDTQKVSNEWIARQLEMVAQRIRDCYKGGTSDWEDNDIPENTELLWEHECPNYGGFRILSDKSLICQYYYKSEPSPHVLSDKLRNEISEYLDSFGDDEQLSVEDISDLFFRANTLLVNVLEGK